MGASDAAGKLVYGPRRARHLPQGGRANGAPEGALSAPGGPGGPGGSGGSGGPGGPGSGHSLPPHTRSQLRDSCA